MLREEDGAGPSGGAAIREIVQTRDLTLGEARALTKVVTQAYVRGLKRDPLYWLALLIHWAALVVLAGSAIIVSNYLRCCGSQLHWLVLGAVPLYFVGAVGYQWRLVRFIAVANQSTILAGTRQTLGDTGYTFERGGQITSIPWRSIMAVERRPNLVMIATSRVDFWPIVAAAYASQDADGFVSELERRWKQARKNGGSDVLA